MAWLLISYWGPTCLPHAASGDRPLESGDLVVMDFARYAGYCSDMICTVVIGKVCQKSRTCIVLSWPSWPR